MLQPYYSHEIHSILLALQRKLVNKYYAKLLELFTFTHDLHEHQCNMLPI